MRAKSVVNQVPGLSYWPRFFLIAQTGTWFTTLLARTSLPPQQATELLRKCVLSLDPDLTIFNAGSLKEQLAFPLFPARAAAIVLGVFGILAMVLAATGLFALMAVQSRGALVRSAFACLWEHDRLRCFPPYYGALSSSASPGIVIGSVITLATGHLLSALLYGTSPHDPATYVASLALMIAVALLACWHPAARAVHIDPARTLREQ